MENWGRSLYKEMYMDRFLPDGYTIIAAANKPADKPRAMDNICNANIPCPLSF
jgi:hypothetical protein